MENYQELHRLIFDTKVQPKKVVLAQCSRCGNEIDRFTWKASKDRIVKKKRLKKSIKSCPYCKAKYE